MHNAAGVPERDVQGLLCAREPRRLQSCQIQPGTDYPLHCVECGALMPLAATSAAPESHVTSSDVRA